MFRLGGSVYGWKPSSYRAELFGALTIVTLCFHVSTYKQEFNQLKAQVYINNRSVVDLSSQSQGKDKLQQLLNDTLDTLNYDYCRTDAATLIPEWDLIAKLQPYLQHTLFQDWDFRWIAGHQDDKTQYDHSSLPAQLNCDADGMANAAQSQTVTETTI